MRRDRAGAVKSLQQNADGLAAALHLELKLEDFLPLKGGTKNMGINDTMFYESPMEVITERINDIHDQTAVLAFNLTALNALMLYESGWLSLDPHNNDWAKPYFAEFDRNVAQYQF